MTGKQHGWHRVSRRQPCKVCRKSSWCLYTGPADSPAAVICPRVESAKRCGEAGWLHELRNDGPTWTPWRRTIRTAIRMMNEAKPNGIDFGKLAAACQKAAKPQALGRLAGSLGLSVESLRRLSVGWSSKHRAWTFPMQDASGKVLGIRLRLLSGRKLSAPGGREGLFIPEGIDGCGRLLVAEGPTDVASLLDLGFDSIGRPSCMGGVRLLVELVRERQPGEIVVVADRDGPGHRGADRLAGVLVAYVPSVRVIIPPAPHKDAREWVRSGATAGDVQAAIDAAVPRQLRVSVKRKVRRCKTATA